MVRPGDQSDDQTFTAFDRDRDQRRVAQLGELGKQCRELGVAVLDLQVLIVTPSSSRRHAP